MLSDNSKSSAGPLSALKHMKPQVVAVKPAIKRGGSWQVTIPKELANILDLKENKLLWIKLEYQKHQLVLLVPNKNLV